MSHEASRWTSQLLFLQAHSPRGSRLPRMSGGNHYSNWQLCQLFTLVVGSSCHQSQAHSYVGTVIRSAHGVRKFRAVVFGGAAAEEASKLPPSARCRLIRLA